MKTVKDSLLSLIDNSANQARSLIDGFSTMVNDINWDEQFSAANEFIRSRKEILNAKANELMKEFSDLVKEVKDSLVDFSVTVPYDESCGEKISYEVKKDGDVSNLIVEVTFNDENTTRENRTVVKVPETCDITKVTKTVNKAAKTATITIPKLVVESTTPQKEAVVPKRKAVRKKAKKVVEAPTEEAVESQVSSKLAEKLKQNVAKAALRRDAFGRFVRRKVEN